MERVIEVIFGVVFTVLAIAGFVGVLLGYHQHLFTFAMASIMAIVSFKMEK